jgi:hypothetical protein
MLKNYTVIGFYESTEQNDSDMSFVACLDGHIEEGSGVGFPGEGVVNAETVLEQPEIFGGNDE